MRVLIFTLIMVSLAACSKSGSGSAARSPGERNGNPTSDSVGTASGPSDFDFNGSWVGEGTVDPRTLWSLNEAANENQYDGRYPRPTAASTPCRVVISMSYSKSSFFKINSAEITMPEIAQTNPYFDAVLTNVSFGPSKQTFDSPDFTIAEATSDHQTLRQKHLAGNYSSAYGSGELLLDSHKLTITSQGPYKGTYPNGDGSEYTSQRDFNFSWSAGSLQLDQISFWSYGNTVSHATEAKCENIVLRKIN